MPATVLASILAEFSSCNDVQRAHFNALLTLLDNGIDRHDKKAMTLAENICRAFEKDAPDMKDGNSAKLLSTVITDRFSSKLAKFPMTKKTIKNNTPMLMKINYQRQDRTSRIDEALKEIHPGIHNWEVTPHKLKYKNGLSTETYHFKNEQGKFFEATLIGNRGEITTDKINNFKDVIKGLYPDNQTVSVVEKMLVDEKGERQTHVMILCDRTNTVTLDQWMGEEDKKITPWTLDDAAVAYENKKKKYIAILDTLDKFHQDLAPLKKEEKFRFDSYGYLNPETILFENHGSSVSLDPAPLFVRGILNHKLLHNNDNNAQRKIANTTPFFARALIAGSDVQRISTDLYSMAFVWEKMFNQDLQRYQNGPFFKTLSACLQEVGNRQTAQQVKQNFLQTEFKTEGAEKVENKLEKLCKGRPGEKQLIAHVRNCLENSNQLQASPEIILETAAMLLALPDTRFEIAAKDWS
jgi:hypothetical protein